MRSICGFGLHIRNGFFVKDQSVVSFFNISSLYDKLGKGEPEGGPRLLFRRRIFNLF